MAALIDPFTTQLGISVWLLVIISVWEAVWTGIAMWKSAQRRHLWWFVIFLIVNFLAIPEIIYLLVTSNL